MSLLLIFSKFFFYLIALLLVFTLNFSYAYFCRHFKQKYFDILETNLNRAGLSLFARYEFGLDYRELKNEERWLSYFIVTIPTLAVYIRCIYYDYAHETSGAYVLVWQVLIHAFALFLAWFRYEQFKKIVDALGDKVELIKTTECSTEQVNQALSDLLSVEEKEKIKFELLKLLNQKFTKRTAFF